MRDTKFGDMVEILPSAVDVGFQTEHIGRRAVARPRRQDLYSDGV